MSGPGRRVTVAELLVDDDVPVRQCADEPDAVGVAHRRERNVVLSHPVSTAEPISVPASTAG